MNSFIVLNLGPKKEAINGNKKETAIDEELRNKLMTVYTSIYAMRKEIDAMSKPFGTKTNPARSCRDIYYAHPTFDDGLHSISIEWLSQSDVS